MFRSDTVSLPGYRYQHWCSIFPHGWWPNIHFHLVT